MSLIINPRGTSGAGKTEFVRRLCALYGGPDALAPVRRPGREKPIALLGAHPRRGRPLVILGTYEATRGGCDTISGRDGGMDLVFDLAADHAARGHDVVLEGLVLSADVARTADLARRHKVHVLRLATTVEQAARNLAGRRRAGRSLLPLLTAKIAREQAVVVGACDGLRGIAAVEDLPFDAALDRAAELLGVRNR